MSKGGPSYPAGASAFGKRLGIARRELGNLRGRDVSKAEVGNHLGVSGQQVGYWESGDNKTDIDTIEKLARFLRVNPGWLAFGVEPMRLHATDENSHRIPSTPMQVVAETGRRRRRGG